MKNRCLTLGIRLDVDYLTNTHSNDVAATVVTGERSGKQIRSPHATPRTGACRESFHFGMNGAAKLGDIQKPGGFQNLPGRLEILAFATECFEDTESHLALLHFVRVLSQRDVP